MKVHKPFDRWYARIAAGLFFCVAGCAGPPSQSTFVPTAPAIENVAQLERIGVTLALHIPRRHGSRRPSTIDANTQSLVVKIDAGRPQVFNTTGSSPGCTSTSTGIACTLRVMAPPGKDTFVVSTFDGPNGTGTLLDYGELKAAIARGRRNRVSIRLGHVVEVSNDNNSGDGSLRDAIADANPGEVVTFALPLPATIALTSGPIELTKNVTITGPGSSEVTVTSQAASQIFIVDPGVTAKISGITLAAAAVSSTSPDGGAIYNAGVLTLASDVISSSKALSAFRRNFVRYQPRRLRFDPRPRSRGARPPRHPRAEAPPRPHVVSPASGGGVYNAGSLTIADSTLSGNSVGEGNGGAVYNAAGKNLVVVRSVLVGNSGGIGGAIDNEGTATLRSDSFSGNAGWPGAGSPSSGAWGYGGAVYSGGNLTIIDSTFSRNVAGGASQESTGVGGAIAQYAGMLTVSGCAFTRNVAGGGTDGSWGYGGAIFYGGNGLSVSSASFSKNEAGGDAFGYGGAVFSTSGLTSSANAFSHNSAAGSGSGGYAYAGAIYSQGAVTLNNDTYNGNSAAGGGSGYGYAGAVDGESDSTIKDTSFTNNAVSAGSAGTSIGGAVFVNGGSSNWTNATFTGNAANAGNGRSYAAGGGAALYASTTITSSTFSSNSASVTSGSPIAAVGGAVAVEEGPFFLTGTLSDNSATTQGGAIWVDDAASITNSAISLNQVTSLVYPNDGGGGIYISFGGVLTVAASTINGNSASGKSASAGGGGMFNAGTLTMTNTTITGNTSSVDGGGFENASTTGASITNATIYRNNAAGEGSSIKNLYSDSTMSIGSSIVTGGTSSSSSSYGNDVSNDGTMTSNDYNIIQVSGGNALTGQTGNNLAVDPKLSPLQNNGGPTRTNADSKSSPGTAYIPYSVCKAAGITTDQRGDPRNGQGGGFCDVGAYEFQ